MEPKKNRDPRKSGRGSRGGASRGSIRPRVQPIHESSSQPVYRPQMYSQSQPGYETSPPQPGYRPQMYPQSPPFYYNQQPLPQLPTNFDAFDTQYTQLPTTQMPTFDPYEPRYTQKKRRDRVSEPLPIHDYNEDDEFFDNVDRGKRPPKNWTQDEEEALAMSWIKISVDREVGDRQKKDGFWGRVTGHFKTLVPGTERNHHQLNSKWTPMHHMIQMFNGYYIQAKRVKASGCDDLQVYETALLDFEKHFKKAFSHTKAWHVLKDQEKWKEQPLVGQTSESTGSSKKRKSSESSSAQTPANETPINVEDFDLPNLNENPTPSRQSRGKKKTDSGNTSRTSMRDAFASYAAEKKSLLESQAVGESWSVIAICRKSVGNSD
ncbi:myb-like domain, Myb/SANT-like DNA-binding domain protein [Artemisia annua]|uniref:Myb-like domain, Myb/SANT-like DNA-binding domain protein n=1 Tax=Artemisia annua TaxID=35608 RepID=A0A2U1LW69_ARTAN|nr:myb-like domain, Myb/SANT-like DNA-binding domain protein [Artemisia annua]